VVKIGGGDTLDHDAIARDIARHSAPLVVVHGGSKELDRVSRALGHPPRYVTSASGIRSRYTDDATLEAFTMVYAGSANKRLVERLQAQGVNAVGLCGLDGRLLEGPSKGTLRIRDEEGRETVLRGDRTGRVERVNTAFLSLLLQGGYVPLVCPPALGYDGRSMNVDGDRAAAAIAGALGASDLVILSDVPGLLREPDDESSMVQTVARDDLESAMAVAAGRMRIKVLAAGEALRAGVRRVVFADGRRERPLSAALAGSGTVFA
jgi:acetylglutamate/LysW-gamma-L-alpha-aminoadipate kinase